ncbi:CRE-JTR-1 protein [Aphelenchoides avenae]|nr:CRE-JTR-1 protein [Aphelenchus avenae]
MTNDFDDTMEEANPPIGSCPPNDEAVRISACEACSPFEMNALKSAYCMETGYFDKYNCSSGKVVYVPCTSRQPIAQTFHIFTAAMLVSAAIQTFFVHWRRGILERRSYSRLQNMIG